MEYNTAFSNLIDPGVLERASSEDVPDVFRSALSSGWTVEARGAWVLRLFSGTFHGDRSSFTDLTNYEASVNGRPIPDLDIGTHDPARPERLARRGYAFARNALFALRNAPGAPAGSAYLSIGPTLYDESLVTGSITFCTEHEGERPYVPDISSVTLSGILVVRSEDCAHPL